MLSVDGVANSLGKLIKQMAARNQEHSSSYLIVRARGKRMSAPTRRNRWDEARVLARSTALEEGDSLLAPRITQFQFRDSARRRHPKSRILRTPACCWDTPRATLQSASIDELGPSPSLQSSERFGSDSKTNWKRYSQACSQGPIFRPSETQKALTNQGFEDGGSVEIRTLGSVSYTHLTLPTIYSV